MTSRTAMVTGLNIKWSKESFRLSLAELEIQLHEAFVLWLVSILRVELLAGEEFAPPVRGVNHSRCANNCKRSAKWPGYTNGILRSGNSIDSEIRTSSERLVVLLI